MVKGARLGLCPKPRDLSLCELPDEKKKGRLAEPNRPIRIAIRSGARVASQHCSILRANTNCIVENAVIYNSEIF